MGSGSVAGGMYAGFMGAEENNRQNMEANQRAALGQLQIEEARRRLAEEAAARKLEADLLSGGTLDQIGREQMPEGTRYATPGASFDTREAAQDAAAADSAQAASAVASNRPSYLPEGATYAPNTTEVTAVGPNGEAVSPKRTTFADARSQVLSKLRNDYAGLGLDRATKVMDSVFANKQGQLFQKAIADGNIEDLVGAIAHTPDGYQLMSGTDPKSGRFGIGFRNPTTGEWYGGAPRTFDSKEHALAEFGTSFSSNPQDYTNYWLKIAEMMRRRNATDDTLQARRDIAELRAGTTRAGSAGRKGSGSGGTGDDGTGIGIKEYAQYTGMHDDSGKIHPAVTNGFMLYQKLRALNPALASNDAGDSIAIKLSSDIAMGRAVPKVAMNPTTGMWQQVATDGARNYVVDEMPAVNPSAMGMKPDEVRSMELGWLDGQKQSNPDAYAQAEAMSRDAEKMRQGHAMLKAGTMGPDAKSLYQMAFLIGQREQGAYKEKPADEAKKKPDAPKFGGIPSVGVSLAPNVTIAPPVAALPAGTNIPNINTSDLYPRATAPSVDMLDAVREAAQASQGYDPTRYPAVR